MPGACVALAVAVLAAALGVAAVGAGVSGPAEEGAGVSSFSNCVKSPLKALAAAVERKNAIHSISIVQSASVVEKGS